MPLCYEMLLAHNNNNIPINLDVHFIQKNPQYSLVEAGIFPHLTREQAGGGTNFYH